MRRLRPRPPHLLPPPHRRQGPHRPLVLPAMRPALQARQKCVAVRAATHDLAHFHPFLISHPLFLFSRASDCSYLTVFLLVSSVAWGVLGFPMTQTKIVDFFRIQKGAEDAEAEKYGLFQGNFAFGKSAPLFYKSEL